jgi:hypothetical protein
MTCRLDQTRRNEPMNMRQFYEKIKEIEDGIKSVEVIVVSNATCDGGKAGIKSEVKRSVAARMVTEGRARLATAEEAQVMRQEVEAAYKRGQEVLNSGKVQLAVLSDSEMKAIKSVLKSR